MAIIHDSWERNGRRFIETNAENQPTGRHVYKSFLGQQNTPDGIDGFVPFLLSAAGIKYGTDELSIDFEDNRQILRRAANVLCSSFQFFVQAQIQGEWVNQPHGVPTRRFRPDEVYRDGVWFPNEHRATGFLSFPDARASFGAQNPYDLFVGLEAGGTDRAGMGIRFRGQNSGNIRFQIVLDGLQRLPTDWEWIESDGGPFGPAEVRRVGIQVRDFVWRWSYDEAPSRSISAERNPDDTLKITLTIGPFAYTANEWLFVYPDTWGATDAADDCIETSRSNYYANVGTSATPNYCLMIGYESGYNQIDAGMTFENVTVPADATINAGTKITVYGSGSGTWAYGGGCDAILKIIDARSVAAWSGTNRPSQLTYHSTAVDWDSNVTPLTSQDSPELSTLVQQRFDDDHVSGDDIAFAWYTNQSSGSGAQYIGSTDASSPADPPELTIVYTSGSTYTLTADGGSFTATGANADLLRGFPLATAGGSFVLTGADATLTRGRSMTAESGAFTATGADAGLTVDRELSAEAGSFSVTGADAGLNSDRILSAEGASYLTTGADAALSRGLAIDADAGSFAVTGADANLIYAGSSTLDAEAGFFTISGADATLAVSRQLSAEVGSYTATGADANFLRGVSLTAESGAVSFVGSDADLLRGLLISADAGSFTWTGADADLSYIQGTAITCDAGAFTIAGSDAALTVARLLSAEATSIALSGSPADLLRNFVLFADGGSFVETGADVDFGRSYVFGIDAGSFAVTGWAAALTYSGFTLPVGKISVTLTAKQPGISLSGRQPGVALSARQPGVSLSAK